MGKGLILLLPAISDTVTLALSGVLAYLIRTSSLFHVEEYIKNPIEYFRLMVCAIILWHLINIINGNNKAKPVIFQIDELVRHFKSTLMLMFAVMAGTFLYKQYDFSRLILFFSWLLFVFTGNIGRQIVGFMRSKLYNKGIGLRKICLIGRTSTRNFLEKRIKSNMACGLKISPLDNENDIEAYLKENYIDELFIFSEQVDYNRIWQLREASLNQNLTIHLVPSFGNLYARQLQGLFFDGTVLISLDSPLTRSASLFIKRTIDVLVSIVFLFIFFPLIITLSALIKITSKGPVFFFQDRVGKDKKLFSIIKFRTMKEDSNPYAETPIDGSDERVTGLGRILRSTGLDEIPQFINVIKGEMSIVGPRPEMPFIVEKYTSIESKRLKVKPGITGLWQVYARAERLPIHQHIEYDLYYIENLSVMLDVMIILDTIPTAILQKGV